MRRDKNVSLCPVPGCTRQVRFGRASIATIAADFASTFPIIEYGIKTADDERAMALRRMARDARRTADFLHAYCHPHRDDPLRIYEVHARDLPSMRELNLTRERLLAAVSEIAQHASGSFIADHMKTLNSKHERLIQACLEVPS